MAKPLNLKALTEEERGVLVEDITLLREKHDVVGKNYYWDSDKFKDLYKKWLKVTNNHYSEGGFAQFRLGIHQMRKTMPNTFKIKNWMDDGTIIRK